MEPEGRTPVMQDKGDILANVERIEPSIKIAGVIDKSGKRDRAMARSVPCPPSRGQGTVPRSVHTE